MMKNSIGHGQVVCRWFAHPLGVFKSAQPLNSLSKLKTQHSGPNLRFIHPESNWRDVENTTNALQVQYDLNTSNSGHDWSSKSIGHLWIKYTHQSQEDRLENRHNWQPSHPTKESLKSEVLKLGEIDTSPWNDFPLGDILLVSLIFFNGTEEGRVIPHLSTSLRLLRLRWLSRELALSPRGSRLSLKCHPKSKKGRNEV